MLLHFRQNHSRFILIEYQALEVQVKVLFAQQPSVRGKVSLWKRRVPEYPTIMSRSRPCTIHICKSSICFHCPLKHDRIEALAFAMRILFISRGLFDRMWLVPTTPIMFGNPKREEHSATTEWHCLGVYGKEMLLPNVVLMAVHTL